MITHCPICRYSLEGLPEKHRCPECGFEYDMATVILKPPLRWRGALLCAFLVGIVISLRRMGLVDSCMIVLFPIAGAFALWALTMREARFTKVLTTSNELIFVRQGKVERRIDLGGIDCIHWSLWDGSVSFVSCGDLEDWLPADPVLTPAFLKKLAGLVQAQLADRNSAVDTHETNA